MRTALCSLFATICTVLVFSPAIASDVSPHTQEGAVVSYFDCQTGQEVVSAADLLKMTDAQRLLVAASGFCELGQYTNGTYYCRKGSCTGTCKLNNVPVSCSCD